MTTAEIFEGLNPAVDVLEGEGGYLVRMDVPGATPQATDVRWSSTRDLVVALAHRYVPQGAPLWAEFGPEEDEITIPLPADAGVEKSRWGLRDGVLVILVPRRVQRVRASGPMQMVPIGQQGDPPAGVGAPPRHGPPPGMMDVFGQTPESLGLGGLEMQHTKPPLAEEQRRSKREGAEPPGPGPDSPRTRREGRRPTGPHRYVLNYDAAGNPVFEAGNETTDRRDAVLTTQRIR